MRRGELYRVSKPTARDPKRSRVFVIISRQILIDSKFSTVVCAPVYSARHGLSSQVSIGVEEGLKHESSIHCDELISLPKSTLTAHIGILDRQKIRELDRALVSALGIEVESLE